MRKRNKRNEKEVRNEEEKKKAEAQKKATEKQNIKHVGMRLFSKTPPPKPPSAAKTKRENNKKRLNCISFCLKTDPRVECISSK